MTRDELKAQIDTLDDSQVKEVETFLRLVKLRNSAEYQEAVRLGKDDVAAGRVHSEAEVRRLAGLPRQ